MRVLVFSDIHGDRRALAALLEQEADLYIAAGDLVTWGRGLDGLGALVKPRAGRLLVLPGNHESATETARFCRQFGLADFHGRSFQAAGFHFAGLGYSSPTPFHTPGEYTEEELASRLSAFAGRSPLVLVCHTPPLGTRLDEAGPGRHYGSRAVKDFIDAQQPDWFLCGHIHEAAGRHEQLGRTRAVNVGPKGYLLELAGNFPADPLEWK